LEQTDQLWPFWGVLLRLYSSGEGAIYS